MTLLFVLQAPAGPGPLGQLGSQALELPVKGQLSPLTSPWLLSTVELFGSHMDAVWMPRTATSLGKCFLLLPLLPLVGGLLIPGVFALV